MDAAPTSKPSQPDLIATVAGWTDDPVRLEAADAPDALECATKPQLAHKMIEKALDAGVQTRWVTGCR